MTSTLQPFPSQLYAPRSSSIDQAKGIFAFIQARHPDKNYDVDGVMSELVNYGRSPDYLSGEVSETISETTQIAGKTARTLFNGLSLLKLSDEIQEATQQGNLPVSHVYLFAPEPPPEKKRPPQARKK